MKEIGETFMEWKFICMVPQNYKIAGPGYVQCDDRVSLRKGADWVRFDYNYNS